MASTPDKLYVTYVDVDRDLLKIWGQRNRIGATYIERQLLQLLPEFNRTLPPNPTQINKGMFCFAKYTDDNYYRARVISRVLNDSVSVLFVDYGNKDVIKLSNIRIQEGNEGDVLAKMSEQAEEYYLARVAAPSGGWTKEIVSEIRRDICYEEFPYRIFTQVGDQKILEIQFRNEDFSSYLVKKQLASLMSLPVQRQIILSYCSLVPSNMKPESSLRDIPKLTFSPSVPPPNMRSFRPSNAVNEGMVQIVKTNNPVNFSQPPSSQLPTSRPVTNLQHMSQSMTKNTYLPPGNVPSNQVQPNLSFQTPVNPAMNAQFNPLQMMKESVDAFASNSNIIQILAQQVKHYITEDNAKNESKADTFPHHYLNSVLEVGSTYNVIISYIDDGPWSFSVQLLSSETELRRLMDELVSTELVPLKPPIILGYPCIASSALYGSLCRGVVVSISHTAVKVYFVDFGNTEDLPSSSIYELPTKFFKVRVLSQKFSLSGLQKVVYSNDIKKFFKEVVQDEFLVLRVVSLEDDNLPTCELFLKDINIKRILNEKIREQRNYTQELPKVGDTENVIVTWVVSPQKFFVQLHKRDADLNALKLELAEVEAKGHNLTYQQLRVGFKCLCLYESDGKWYRALITAVDSENTVTVFYVDYGNTETVNISRLRRIDSSVLINEMNYQAIQCSLKGFENKAFDQELANKLEALVLEKDVQMTVVSCEKEVLCVQLFDNGSDISTVLLPSLPTYSISDSQEKFSQDQACSFEKQRKFDAVDSRDKRDISNFSGDKNRQKNSGGRAFNNFQSFKSPVQSAPSKSKRRAEENWRSDSNKDNYWSEPKPSDQNSGKIRGSRQGRETGTWDSNNNSSNNNNYFNVNSYNTSNNSKFGGPRQDKGGFKQEKSRSVWGNKNDNYFGERKFDENRGGRERADDRKSGAGDRKRIDRSRGRDDNVKKFERNESGVYGKDKKTDERRSNEKPVSKEDIAPPGSKFEDRVIDLDTGENGIITYYFSPHEFFVQLLAQEKDFKKMMADIQSYYSDKSNIRDPVQAGDIVIAQFSLDKVLYRAEVVKPSPLTVRYVDYGNHEPVGLKATWPVDKQFLKLPKQVIKCRLANIEPIGSDWPPPGGAVDKFFEFAEYKCKFLSVEGDMYEISLQDVATGKDIAQELIAAGHARPMAPKLDVPKFDFSLLPNQVLRLYVSHVVSASNFYVILNPKGLEVIENELKALADEKKNLVPINGALIKTEMSCLSTTDDVSWCRGNIIETDGNKILVHFVDRGDSCEVTSEKVMCLPDYLKVFPPQAVKCSLHGSSIIQSEEEFKKAVELKHHLVSFVSATDDSASVVLYAEDGRKIDFQKCDDYPQTISPISHLPIISQKLSVVISHLESPNELYVQRSADYSELVNLSEHLSNFYSEEREGYDIKQNETEGVFLAAKSVFYDTWYRGRLVSSSEDGLEVFYIDYGNKEILPKENVKKLDPSFLSLNAFSKKMTLDVEFDAEKTEDINNRIFEFCQDKDILGYFKNVDGKLISEFTVNGERITRMLSLSKNGTDKFDEILSGERTKRKTTVLPQQQLQKAETPESADLRVFVSHIDSPNQFWVYKESMSAELHQFQDKLQKCCEILPDKENVQVDDVVSAVFSDMWYRARVKSVDGDKLTVQFIDYGNTFMVDLSCSTVKELTEELLRVPVFATPYALTGTWNKNSTSKFEEIILQNEDSVKVVVLEQSDPVIVDLYQNGRSISEMLKEQVHADEDENLCTVYISHSNSPNDFYIQRGSCEDTIKEINERLADVSSLKTPSTIEENKIYAAKFPDDGAWYRAKVGKKHGDAVEVIFVDYGNTSNVTEVRCLPSDLVDIPNLAENCSLLYGEKCDSWSEAACDKFSEFADGRKLKMKIVVNRVKKSVVKLMDGDKNITEILEELCEKDGRSEVYVSHALSPTEFYMQYVDDENYKLITKKLENGEECEDLEDKKPGVLCQALFVDDGYWYRAKILRELDVGAEVFFIDFGNTSVATELKKLPPEIEEIPPVALKCTLNLPETNIPESVKEEFINLTAGGGCVFRALIIVPDEINVVSLKLDGVLVEESLNLDVIPEENAFFSDSLNPDGFPHSVGCETDDGKNSKKNLAVKDYLMSNLADDLRNGDSASNETDEEKRVKIAISGIEGSDGFKSDDEKGIEGASPSGFINATDSELMEEVRESNALDTDSAQGGREEAGRFGEDLEETSGEGKSVTDIKQNGASHQNYYAESPGFDSGDVENVNKSNSRNKVHKIVPGSISRGEEEEIVDETSPVHNRKLNFSEKSVPGSISRGVSLETMQSEQESLEKPPERQSSQSAPNTPNFPRRNDGYVKIDPSDRLIPGCISTGNSLHCSPSVKKVPSTDKIVPGAVNGSVKDD